VSAPISPRGEEVDGSSGMDVDVKDEKGEKGQNGELEEKSRTPSLEREPLITLRIWEIGPGASHFSARKSRRVSVGRESECNGCGGAFPVISGKM
jgi:hypothetical protein